MGTPVNGARSDVPPAQGIEVSGLPKRRCRQDGPAAARNLGWRMADGEIIAFTDDDCIPEPDWLANGVSAFVEGVAGVSGRTVVPMPANPTDNELNTTHLQRSDFITANCFYRREVLEEVGGFDERFTTAWREDSDLYFSVRERNYSLAWARGATPSPPATNCTTVSAGTVSIAPRRPTPTPTVTLTPRLSILHQRPWRTTDADPAGLSVELVLLPP